ncbi:MAG: hypothetical protein SP4CHLAM5_09700 [Chlamydiia bacterium]|nr:hypothetical protein [Chlamydiia bacterium]MCH9618828.1 hypothetical protein [Chlamydiia bacterium]MCH9624370.1 hypothetical protein [Chlamydiia bacterium]
MTKFGTLTFTTLVTKYMKLQSQVMNMVRKVASRISAATPGKFLLLQFSMSQVTQIGSSISNLLAQVNSVINKSIQNQRTQ